MPSNSNLEPNMPSSSRLKPNMLDNSILKPNFPSNFSLEPNLPNTSSLSPDTHPSLPHIIELNQPIVSPGNEGVEANLCLEEPIGEFYVYS